MVVPFARAPWVHVLVVVLLAASGMALTPVAAEGPVTHVVTTSADSGHGSLREALALAVDGDTIVFDAALDGQPIHLDSTLAVGADVTIVGNGMHVTQIDGRYKDRLMHVTADVVLQDLALINGWAEDARGAGVWNQGALRLERVLMANVIAPSSTEGWDEWNEFEDNFGGGAIHSEGPLEVLDSVFRRNQGPEGGAIHAKADAYIEGSTFEGNAAPPAMFGGMPGGTLLVAAGETRIVRSTIDGSYAGYGGGLLVGAGATVRLESSSIRSGTADSEGGGILSYGTLHMSNSTVAGNGATHGGGLYLGGGTATITSSLLQGNRAHGDGGAIVNEAALSIRQATISGNKAGAHGGGVVNAGGAAQLLHVTLADNDAQSGSALWNPSGSVGLAASALSGPGDDCAGTSPTSSGHNAADASCGLDQASDLVDVDLVLGDLQDHGGATLAHMPFALSPLIDAITGCAAGTDQRGLPRPAGAGCDIGALEVQDGEERIAFSIEAVDGTVPDTLPYVEAEVSGLLQLNLRAAPGGSYDLTEVGADATTTFNVTLPAVDFEPRLLIGAGDVATWSAADNGDGTWRVDVSVRPVAQQTIVDCDRYPDGCVPSIEDWPKGRRDIASQRLNASVQLAFDDLPLAAGEAPGFTEAERTHLTGAVLTTDAQAFGVPEYLVAEDGTASLSLFVAGPHRTVDDEPHEGFYEAFLPPALLEAWGIGDDLSALGAAYDEGVAALTATPESGGVRVHVPIHYSSGTVSLHTVEVPEALQASFAADATARVGEPLTLRDASLGGGAITNWTWTFSDGTPAAYTSEATVTPERVGALRVTLTVSDGESSDSVTRPIQVFQAERHVSPFAQGDHDFTLGQTGGGALGRLVFTATQQGKADVDVRLGAVPDVLVERVDPVQGKRTLRYLEVEEGAEHAGIDRVNISLSFTPAELEELGLLADDLEILYWNGAAWRSTSTDTDETGNITGTPRTKDLHVFSTGGNGTSVWAVVNHTSQYALAGPAPSSAGGGGGGGGGGSRVPGLQYLGRVLAGDPATARIGHAGVDAVVLDAAQTLPAVQVAVEALDDHPTGAPGTVLSYVDISVTTRGQPLPEGSLRSASIGFRVAADQVADGAQQRVLLMHWDGQWRELPTTFVERDGDELVFRATTTSFSPFAVVMADASGAIEDASEGDEELDTVTAERPSGGSRGLIAVLAVALVAAGGGYAWWRTGGLKRLRRP